MVFENEKHDYRHLNFVSRVLCSIVRERSRYILLLWKKALTYDSTVIPNYGQNATGQNATGQNVPGQNAIGQNATRT